MTPQQKRRLVIPLIVVGIAISVVLVAAFTPRKQAPAPPPEQANVQTPAAGPGDTQSPSAGELDTERTETNPADTGNAPPEDRDASPTPSSPTELHGLRAIAPDGTIDPGTLDAMGSFDPDVARMRVTFAPNGAGIENITFSNLWETAAARHEAKQVLEAIRKGEKTLADLPADDRYVLATPAELGEIPIPILAAHSIVIAGQTVNLFDREAWSSVEPGHFVTTIVNDAGENIVRITRHFVLTPDGYDLTLEQAVTNLTSKALEIQWRQYGPGDLRVDRARYMDRRRFRLGVLIDPAGNRDLVSAEKKLLLERTSVIGDYDKSFKTSDDEKRVDLRRVYPSKKTTDRGYELSWFAATNRYFALAVHPVLNDDGSGDKSLTNIVQEIQHQASSRDKKTATIFTVLFSPIRTLAPNGQESFDLGIYAGPQDRTLLTRKQPYNALAMRGLIIYQMSSWCAICTFQPLAKLLLSYLSFIESLVGDWGIAIILLVLTVRTLLHPITKRSQIGMQRMGKGMAAMKPEMDRLRKKYGDDQKKIQQEQLRLMREHNVNPLGCLGILPMFLQTPIWIALYAMLYFAWDIHHQPAFYGVFQLVPGWSFLSDLSAADHAIYEFETPRQFLIWNITGINVLPILMGLIFYVQQKYLTPPNPNMTPEQATQQKMMRVMMVVLFPLMLYSAPSGLTLYILTSSCIGILESRYIRNHIDQMDLEPQKREVKTRSAAREKRKKPKDPQGRAYADALDRAKKRAIEKQQAKRSFKKRK